MKLTVLDIVQKTLNSLSSDEVSTVAETVESAQILDIVEDVFYSLVTNKIIPEHEGLTTLESLSDATRPNYLRLTDTMARIKNIRYNVSDTPATKLEYKTLDEVTPDVFLQRMMALDNTDTKVDTVLDPTNGVKIMCYNDQAPKYWTSFDDEHICFNAYNSDVETTIMPSKALCITHIIPDFTKEDSFVPDIDDNLFPLLLNEVKAWAHVELRQSVHPKAEQAARTQKVQYQRFRQRTKEDDTRRDFGR